jgi:hypothetical protein
MGAAVAAPVIASAPVDLISAEIQSQGASSIITLRVTAPTARNVSVSADGLVLTINLPDVVNLPTANPQASPPFIAILVDRITPDKGVRLSYFAQRPMRLMADQGTSDPKTITIALSVPNLPRPPVAVGKIPWLETAMPSLPAWREPPRLHRPQMAPPALAKAEIAAPPALLPSPPKPEVPKPETPKPEVPKVEALPPAATPTPPVASPPATPPLPVAPPPPNAQTADAAPTRLGPKPSARPNPPEGIAASDPMVKAALANDDKAAVQLGTLCLGQEPPDPVSARGWFALAADRGNAIGHFNIGEMYRRGVGGPVDEAKAIDHYTKAADAGIALARYRLALMLLIGRGAIQDVPRARALLEAAALQGHSPSRRLLDDLNRGLDPEKPKDP